ncbi:exodeoxyribonuclease I [Ranunculus cassubicifolius]
MNITTEYTQSTFLITIFNNKIKTTITHHPISVSTFISTLQPHNSPTIIGLDIEWRPSFSSCTPPISTLQLCTSTKCLIFQLLHAPSIPNSLFHFLNNPNFCFVGVGIKEDVDKLWRNNGLYVRNFRDLREMAVEKTGRVELRNTGLMGLGKEILGWEIEKPKNVTMSNWENERLSDEQIQYACVDAYLSYSIGQCLIYG